MGSLRTRSAAGRFFSFAFCLFSSTSMGMDSLISSVRLRTELFLIFLLGSAEKKGKWSLVQSWIRFVVRLANRNDRDGNSWLLGHDRRLASITFRRSPPNGSLAKCAAASVQRYLAVANWNVSRPRLAGSYLDTLVTSWGYEAFFF